MSKRKGRRGAFGDGLGPMASNGPLLPPSAGYPGPTAARLDPLMGRGYLIGKQEQLAAGETKTIANHGQQDHYFRWKITLGVSATPGVTYLPNTAYFAEFSVTIKVENEIITRTCAVPLGGAQVIYAPGRAIEIVATNPSALGLTVEFGLDEATPGLATWTLDEVLTNINAETALDVPAFATTLQLYAASASPGFTLRGYDTAGAVIYDEVLTAPRSAELHIPAGLVYTIQNIGPGAQSGLIHYRCVG